MVGNEALYGRLAKELHGRLLEQGGRERRVRRALRGRRDRPPAVRRLGRLLVTIGRRLEGTNLRAHPG